MKRTYDNCLLNKKVARTGVGYAEKQGNKCLGFARSEYDDEPCATCNKCKLNVWYNSEDDKSYMQINAE